MVTNLLGSYGLYLPYALVSPPRDTQNNHIPCFRVVNAKGELAGAFAFGGEDVQAELLRADGVEVINGRVDLGKYGICVCGNLGKNSGRY